MNSLQITYFLALCKYKNFTETANRLYVSQPAVSRQIRMLEEEFNVQLFQREYKKNFLTEEGKILQKTLEEIVTSLQKAQDEMYRKKFPQKHSFKIAILQGLEIADILRPAIQRFMQKYPDTDVTLECYSHEKMNIMLRLNELDMAITLNDEIKNDSLLKSIHLFRSNFAFTVHESHPLFHVPKFTPELLKKQQIFTTSIGTKDFEAFLNALCSNYSINEEQLLSVSNMDEIITLLNSGFGIAVLTEQKRFSGGHYRQFPLKSFSADIACAWHYTNINPARALLLDDILKPLIPPKII